MNEEQRFISFYDENSDNFYELLDGVRTYLRKNNSEYKQIHGKIQDIMDSNVNIQNLFEDEPLENGLSKGECLSLSKLILLYFDLQEIVEKEMYFKGGMDAYYYFCKLGIMKTN